MKKCFIHKIVVLTTLFFCQQITAQSDYFHEINFSKNLNAKDLKNTYNLSLGWKHIYTQENWNRITTTAQLKRQLNTTWAFGGGLSLLYNYDKEIKNNLEFRPFLFINLKSSITDDILLSQTLRSELRTFFFKNNSSNFTTTRLRYNINALIELCNKQEEKTSWKLRPEIEWYIQKNKEINERFINSTEYGLTIIRKNTKAEICFGYKLEHFNENFFNPNTNGHTFILEINY